LKESISVAIPVFNRADWIGKTLEHIFSQSVPVDEVVLCDDGSTDDLEQAIQDYRSRIKVIRIENSGPAIARKTAIAHSNGDWIALCDSDDFWCPNHLENFLNSRTQFPDSNLYFSNFSTSDKPDQTKFEFAPEGWFKRLTGEPWEEAKLFYQVQNPFLETLLEFQACFQSCLIFRRDVYQAAGGINDCVSRWASEDFHLTARLAAFSDAVVCTEKTVLINKHEGNFSSEYVRNLEGEVRILQDIRDRKLVPDSLMTMIGEQLNHFSVRLFRSYYWTSQNKKAVQLARNLPSKNLGTRDRIRFLVASIRGVLGL
jgi:glycosyltransferase involved in cell wall biosynthesis